VVVVVVDVRRTAPTRPGSSWGRVERSGNTVSWDTFRPLGLHTGNRTFYTIWYTQTQTDIEDTTLSTSAFVCLSVCLLAHENVTRNISVNMKEVITVFKSSACGCRYRNFCRIFNVTLYRIFP